VVVGLQREHGQQRAVVVAGRGVDLVGVAADEDEPRTGPGAAQQPKPRRVGHVLDQQALTPLVDGDLGQQPLVQADPALHLTLAKALEKDATVDVVRKPTREVQPVVDRRRTHARQGDLVLLRRLGADGHAVHLAVLGQRTLQQRAEPTPQRQHLVGDARRQRADDPKPRGLAQQVVQVRRPAAPVAKDEHRVGGAPAAAGGLGGVQQPEGRAGGGARQHPRHQGQVAWRDAPLGDQQPQQHLGPSAHQRVLGVGLAGLGLGTGLGPAMRGGGGFGPTHRAYPQASKPRSQALATRRRVASSSGG